MPVLAEIKEQLKKKGLAENQGIFIYLDKLTDFEKQEIAFHDQIVVNEREVHQLDSLRNRYYHDYFKKWLLKLPEDSVILEIGAGSGYDALPLLKSSYQLIESDISLQSVRLVKQNVEKILGDRALDSLLYLVADGQKLPLENDSVGGVFLVATLHHFQDQLKALLELKRVVKKDGLLVLAMEPSVLMMKLTKLFAGSKKLRIFDSSSVADENHPGYSRRELLSLFDRSGWRLVRLKPVWLTLGVIHYALEFLFRFFKFKKRLKLPWLIEGLFLLLDELLLRLPLIKKLNWHWIVVLRKADQPDIRK